MKVMQRAEKVFLELGHRVSELRDQTYAQQERLAKKVVEVFQRQTVTKQQLPSIELLKAASSVAIAVKYEGPTRELFNKGIEAAANAQRTTSVDIPEVAAQSEINLLQSQQGQVNNSQSAFQSAQNTIDTTLQRLQQIESSAKAGG